MGKAQNFDFQIGVPLDGGLRPVWILRCPVNLR